MSLLRHAKIKSIRKSNMLVVKHKINLQVDNITYHMLVIIIRNASKLRSSNMVNKYPNERINHKKHTLEPKVASEHIQPWSHYNNRPSLYTNP